MPKTIKKISFSDLDKAFFAYGVDHKNNEDYTDFIEAVIVYKQSNFNKPYTVKERSYKVQSCCRRWQNGKCATSYIGDCLDGKDLGVRLDCYRWDIDYCYLLQ